MGPRLERFGDQITADTFINHDKECVEYYKQNGIVMFDRASQWIECYPKARRTFEDTLEAFRHFRGKEEKIRSFYSDNAGELIKVAEKMRWRTKTSTPGAPKKQWIGRKKSPHCERRRTYQHRAVRIQR